MKQTFQIEKKRVGQGQPTFVIAEAGSNHDRNLIQAKKLIDIAAISGADAVKFQLFRAEVLYPKTHPAFKVVRENEFPRQWLHELVAHARTKKIIFLATPFDVEAVDQLVKEGIPALKWGSSEVTNLNLLRYAASRKKPILLATGMSDLSDIQESVEVLSAAGCDELALLHCASVYPCPANEANLRVMDTFAQAFGVPVGFSDHSLGLTLPVVAVARGAKIIEKHFTISRDLKGPDHSYALEPNELKQMMKMIRETEQSLGSSVKTILPDEAKYGRRDGLYAAKAIKKGEIFSKKNMAVKRPAVGVKSRFYNLVVGKKALRAIPKDSPIHWKDL